jgi:hypothetical protein
MTSKHTALAVLARRRVGIHRRLCALALQSPATAIAKSKETVKAEMFTLCSLCNAKGHWLAALFLASAWAAAPARADVLISSDATQNMTCSNGICSPTAADAVLNVGDLEGLLESGDLIITTTGAGSVQAHNINVEAAFGWSTANTLSLDAFESIAIDRPTSVDGNAALSLETNDGGSDGVFSIGRKGSLVFQNLSSRLAINGTSYALVNSISALATAIASNPSGAYALANSYDASVDGTYTASPIQPTFFGALEGLGNTISNLSITEGTSEPNLGLFTLSYGSIEHLGLSHVTIVGSKQGHDSVGALAGTNAGNLFQVVVTGDIQVRGRKGNVGGLAGANEALIDRSFASVRIRGAKASSKYAGGLFGVNLEGTIRESFATGAITLGDSAVAGGLAGLHYGNTDTLIENSYATGAVTGGANAHIGGFTGQEFKRDAFDITENSYSIGAVTGGMSSLVGGFVGVSTKLSLHTNVYWDVDTSGTTNATGRGKSRGIQGLSTGQLQSGLPQGFDPKIWAEKPKINNGLPYLISNPPPT